MDKEMLNKILDSNNMPKIGDTIYVLRPCTCIKEKHQCMPSGSQGTTYIDSFPISSLKKIREFDGVVLTRQKCLRLYESDMKPYHLNHWGTMAFATKQEAIDKAKSEFRGDF